MCLRSTAMETHAKFEIDKKLLNYDFFASIFTKLYNKSSCCLKKKEQTTHI